MPAAIQIRGLRKAFGRTKALDGVSFEVPAHSIFGLLGPNGAGKTTLFSIAANFLRADEGTVEVLGIDTQRISQLQGRLTILPQDAHFQRNVPILEQLAFFRRLDGRPRDVSEREVLESLARVGLESAAKRRVGTLSHGMIQRLGVAQAFLGRPEVILLDEPTSGLDPANARQIRDLVKQLQQQATIVVSSHNLAEIQELCDHVAILDRGKLVLAAPVDEITRAGREYIITLSRTLSPDELGRVIALPGVRSVDNRDDAGPASYRVTLDLSQPGLELDAVLSTLLRTLLDNGLAVRKLTEGRSLETQFLAVTGGTAAPAR